MKQRRQGTLGLIVRKCYMSWWRKADKIRRKDDINFIVRAGRHMDFIKNIRTDADSAFRGFMNGISGSGSF